MDRPDPIAIGVAALVMLASCAGVGGRDGSEARKLYESPAGLGAITKTVYDGVSDDLLTAGLGKSGLAVLTAPAPANPAAPTAAELRRLAIFSNYRAVLDINPRGGYGTLYGPNIDVDGNDTLGEGKIAGTEYVAYIDDGSGKQNVTLMVQVPASFRKERACIVAAASSGSRGVYGAIGSAGEWGLKHGCAVAYTDKGTGLGVYDLATNTVNLQNGVRAGASVGKDAHFAPDLGAPELAAYNRTFPNRVAFKHAMSGQNPEKDWGRNVLDAVRMAFHVLNDQFAPKLPDGTRKAEITPRNTIVIASSVSTGGAAAIAAAEQDTEGLIDGVAVAEPVLELMPDPKLAVKFGSTTLAGGARPLFDYITLANLYQPCASLSARADSSDREGAVQPTPALAANRCAGLKARGHLQKATLEEQAEEALDVLLAAGWLPESSPLHASHYMLAVPPVAATYAYAYGRFGVTENLCGLSFASRDAMGRPDALRGPPLAQIFGTGNGIPPTGGFVIINNDSVGGPIVDVGAVSPSTGLQDYGLDAAICLRNLWTGTDAKAVRLQSGVKETLRSGDLHGKPAIIVAGRSDALVPVNFNARPYFGQNKRAEGAASKLAYIEVTNAQHFDALIDWGATPGYDSAFVPLHYYFGQAMDRVFAHLANGTPLPPSQVVRTVPRGGTPGQAPAITKANVPPMSGTPAPADRITFSDNVVSVPGADSEGAVPLTAGAALGARLFNDPSLSASGRMSCATCHAPATAHSTDDPSLVVPAGGAGSDVPGFRNGPSLRYVQRTPAFFFDRDGTPTGGFNRDGRAASLEEQARRPFVEPHEMANASTTDVVAKVARAAYADEFRRVFGAGIFDTPDAAFDRIVFAIAQFEREDRQFAPFDSKYDLFLAGRLQLTHRELQGLALFRSPQKGNCAACHPTSRASDGSPPLFTDFTYDNVGLPRNRNITANADPAYFDLGLCGPFREDLAQRRDLCGAFKVPTLRNVAVTAPYFHNGQFKTLREAVSFYVRRDTHPEEWYPVDAAGKVRKFDDLPPDLVRNVNVTEMPYNRKPGQPPALTPAEIDLVVEFLNTLTDGYRP